MVLFDTVLQVFTLADLDRLQPTPGTILQAICGVTGNDSLQVGLATVDDDAVGPAISVRLAFFTEDSVARRAAAAMVLRCCARPPSSIWKRPNCMWQLVERTAHQSRSHARRAKELAGNSSPQ
jgi:hypothetical protein